MTGGLSDAGKVTYLIANYNRAAYVGDCIASLKAQTDPRWLAIVVDDASTDHSVGRITALLDHRIRLVANSENLGYIATLERLISEATTDIVAILDADDAIEPETTAELRRQYEANPSAVLVFSRFAEYDETLTRRLGTYGGCIPNYGTAIIDGPIGAIRSFRRSAYAMTDGLDHTMNYAEDRDLVYKLEELAPPVFIDRVLYRYRSVRDSQVRDPSKREIGLINARRARRGALDRRGIRGPARLAAEWAISCDYIASSGRYPSVAKTVASFLGPLAAMAWRKLGVGLRNSELPTMEPQQRTTKLGAGS